MRGKLRRWWPAVRALLGLAILFLIGRQFAADLGRPGLWQRPLDPGWLALSGLLYLAGVGLSALFWHRLLGRLGHPAPLRTVLRAYYLGHLGKYLPGKAWALWLRADLVRGAGVPPVLAALTAFYEVLTTMCSGVLLAVPLFALLGTDAGAGLSPGALAGLARFEVPAEGGVGRWVAVVLAALLALATGVPLLPPLFNRLSGRLTLPFRAAGAGPLPPLRGGDLAEGLGLTALGWLLLAGALAATLRAVVGPGLAWTPAALARLPAALAVAYVAGFVILLAPSGLGVREFFLALFLTPELSHLADLEPGLARAQVILAVVVLRLVWTTAELLLAGALLLLPAAPEPLKAGVAP